MQARHDQIGKTLQDPIIMNFSQAVDQFLLDYPDISATQFGTRFRKDPNFVSELKKGRSPRLATVEQVLMAMDDYRREHPRQPASLPSHPKEPLHLKEQPGADMDIRKSAKLKNVCYDIRGPVLKEATAMEEMGHRIIKLNIGNPAPFGFEAPQEILADVITNLPSAIGYCDSKGLFAARKAIVQYYQQKRLFVDVGDIYIGNGVSELIVMAMQALLDDGDEMLIPSPDYPLWTAAVTLSGGTPVHYLCDEEAGWFPDIADMERKITSKTRGIVIINPNNPTGAVYSKELLEQVVRLARKHNLILFADEIYDKILYDEARHTSIATLAPDLLCLTFNGLSKAYRVAGFRSGWLMVSGNKKAAKDYIEGLDMLASMRLCANVPAQHAIQTALGGYQSINDLILPGGRLHEQRNLAWDMLTAIPGVSCVKPDGALYLFPRLDPKIYPIQDDQEFILEFLQAEKVLLVQGTGFNWAQPDHFRVVFLPGRDELAEAITRLARFLDGYRHRYA